MYQLTEVVKNLLIINVIMYVATTMLFPNLYPMLVMHFPTMDGFMPVQIVTHMFMHSAGGIGHIFFNMIGLYFFGPPLEQVLGPKKFLILYLSAGLGALLLHLLVNWVEINYMGGAPGRMLGASGAVFGLLAAYAMYYPNNVISLIFPPISLKAKYFVLIYGAMELFLGFGSFNTGIAHFAHIGGAIVGAAMIFYWRRN